QKFMVLLSRLMFQPSDPEAQARLKSDITSISREDFDELVNLANSNHVIVRGMELFLKIVREANDQIRTEWAAQALETELARIRVAVPVLYKVCKAFDEA